MLSKPSNDRRLAGKALIALSAATALPLTASWATVYVDISSAAPNAPAAGARAPATSLASVAQTAGAPMASAAASVAAPEPPVRENGDGTVTLAGGVRLDKGSTAFFANDDVLINGKVKRLEQLTPAERAKLRAVILKSQHDLARDRAALPRELAQLRREAERARSGELRREHLRDIEDMRRDLAEIASRPVELRAEGEDTEQRKAEILRDLRGAETRDIVSEEREAIAEADPNRRTAELGRDEQQMARMLAKLDQLDRRD